MIQINRIILLLAIMLIASAIDTPVSAKEIVVDSDSVGTFKTIQEAVNNSSPGDKILVYPGIYNESVEVGVRNIQILGTTGYPEVKDFTVDAGDVTISGFSIWQGTITTGLTEDCLNGTFSDNVLLNSSIVLYASGETMNFTIANNTIQDGSIGLSGVSGNRIINNTISNTISDDINSYGITFFEAHDNYVANNYIFNSNYGISMTRLSGNNYLVNNTLTSNDIGISITDSASGDIIGNTITENNIGIWLEGSSSNVVKDNKLELNRKYGVYLNQISNEASNDGKTLICNNLFNNTVNLFNDTSGHYTSYLMNYLGIVPVAWNTTKMSEINIAGGPYSGGNFWAKPDGTGFSQTCNDWDGDGIGDSLYTVSANDIDYLPLVSVPEPQLVFPAANFSMNVSSGYTPLSVLFTDLSQNATSREWDFNGDGIVDSIDTNPVYVYTEPGTYTISLTVSNANGTVSRLSSITISIKPRYILNETQITTNKSNQTNPDIYGDLIVWQDDRSGNYTAYMYDLSASKETQLSANTSWEWKPAIYKDKIVWQYSQNGTPYIHMYNVTASKEIQITPNKAWEPAIYGDRIVYTDTRNGNADIYLCDLSTSTETQITTDESDQTDPDIYENGIVWEDSRNGNADIYMFNLSTSKETRITTNNSDQHSPAIYGDRIVWEDYRNGPDIYMNDLSTSKETRITSNEYYQLKPDIYEDRIVWMDERNGWGNYDIYMYDLSTSIETQVTTNKSDQMNPSIYGDRIVWEDYRNGNNRYGDPDRNPDIYMCTLSPNLSTA